VLTDDTEQPIVRGTIRSLTEKEKALIKISPTIQEENFP
jgi:hypothetical protein